MTFSEFASPPGLGRTYLRAALRALPLPASAGRDDRELPASHYRLAAQRIDRDHLSAYQRVSGFRVSDVVPATYLHVLAFPLSVRLMTEPGFPLGLVGLVHLRNTITVHRPIGADEIVDLEVHQADLGHHPAGRTVDIAAQAVIGGEPVWLERSTYLRPSGARPRGARAPRSGSDEIAGTTAHVRVPTSIGRRYATVSGDRNPIHLSALSARPFGFRSAIAHGMWLKSRALATLEGRLPPGYTVDVRFKTPVFLPTTVAVASVAVPDGWDLDVRGVRDGKPHLSATIRGV